ncbi:MAG: flagellar biosynthesis protein FlhB [Pirellulales bacterium]|nr:flagellar biosynthesis protein FlhB [Pirellulales bacterium]
MADHSGEKTQDATPYRRQKAREEGQVARSQDLASAVILVAGLGLMLWLGQRVIMFMSDSIATHTSTVQLTMDPDDAFSLWNTIAEELVVAVLPVLGMLMLVGVAVNVLQTGFIFLPNKLAPEWSRISPLKGLKRIFSLAGAMRLSFGVFKVAIIAVVAYAALYARLDELLALPGKTVGEIGAFLLSITIWTAIKIGGALLLLAILDFAFQRWKHEQDLKMTQQEVREEMKNLQGDPETIARRKAVQRQLVLNRLSTDIPKADVVVTNPTELAIAIQYDAERMKAPVVLAKGAGALAARIRRLALENDVPIVEKKELARALYKNVEVNHPVPSEQYAAVAEVLAYVYQLKGKSVPGSNAA